MMNHHKLQLAMMEYYSGDPKRIQHFLKVYEFAKMIGEGEQLPEETQHILETAALVHDIGIRNAEEKFGSCSGKLQEQEGPAEAEKMLSALGYAPEVIRRVSYLVGHHHTYRNVQGEDYRILLEADFLVNGYEDALDKEALQKGFDNIFRTDTGKKICQSMFGL